MAASNTRSYTMAAEAAIEIVMHKLEILLSHPVPVRFLSMRTRTMVAQAKVATVQEFLSTQRRSSNSMEWLERLLKAMSYAEEFIDKFHLREARKSHKALCMAMRPLAALASKYILWKDLSNLVNDMETLCQDKFLTGKEKAEGKRKKEPASTSFHASVPRQGKKLVRLTGFLDQQAFSNFKCREDVRNEIRRRIRDRTEKCVQGISICGEQGIGKTFLARWAYREAMYLGFEWCAWVQVLASMDKREFLFEILKQVEKVPTEVKDLSFYEITVKLCQKLTGTKGFLLVLDDVDLSNEQLLQELMKSILFSSQVLVITTTQCTRIARIMAWGTEPINLTNLGHVESQRMLAGKLHRPPVVESLTEEEKNILKRCPGLPLCISLLGGLLLNAGDHERAALLKDSSVMTLLEVLQLSYDRLPAHLKLCFVYMAWFPVASAIPTRRLVRLWLAEGLLDACWYEEEGQSRRQPEKVGERFILELADRKLIDVVSWRADGFPKVCQMHTSLYKMIHLIAMSTRSLQIHGPTKDPTSQQQQLPIQMLGSTEVQCHAEHKNTVTDSCGGSFPDLYLGHVRSFPWAYMRSGILTSMFLRNMTSKTAYGLLRVLDLEGVYNPSLLGVLHKLVLLRYLGLRCTVLHSLPSAVMDLHYLETLDIKHTNITSLPSSFWKARNLRHLHLNWFYIDLKDILKACSHNVALTKLQTLSGLVIGEVGKNWMRSHRNYLTTLTTLKLFLDQSTWDPSRAAAVAEWISSELVLLQSLTFGVIIKAKPAKEAKPMTAPIGPLPELSLAERHHVLFELYLLGQLNKPTRKQLLPSSLRVLTLSGSQVTADMMPQLGGRLKNLRTFRLLANSFLGTSLKFVKHGFPSLMILKIWKLPYLEKVIIEQGAMLHLKELELRHLERLKTVEGIKECKELETICVTVKKFAHGFVDRLKKGKGETAHLYVKEETETLEHAEDDDSHDKAEDVDEDEDEDEDDSL